MMLFWKIRYFDRTDKQFKDRCLTLNTKALDPATRAAIELVAEQRSFRTERDILKYRSLFVEGEEAFDDTTGWDKFKTVGPMDYFEDETGAEISVQDAIRVQKCDPTLLVVKPGMKKHDIEYALSPSTPVPVVEVSLSQEQIRLLAIFAQNYQELRDSAFMRDSPGILSSMGGTPFTFGSDPELTTAATDDEIRSFVTIFRRLYMTSGRDPANIKSIVPIFAKALGEHALAKWVSGVAQEYQGHLDSVPDCRPIVQSSTCNFTVKRLIDVFIYTQYAHQPSENSQRQFAECLSQVGGKKAILTWMFVSELWKCSTTIVRAGKVIAGWFDRYCKQRGVSPDVPPSLRYDHKGIGAAEKEEVRKARLLREKVEQLARDLWQESGEPAGGHYQFLEQARQQLSEKLAV